MHSVLRYHHVPRFFALDLQCSTRLELCIFRRHIVIGDGESAVSATPTCVKGKVAYPSCDEFVDVNGNSAWQRIAKFEKMLQYREKVRTHERRLELELPTEDPRIAYHKTKKNKQTT